MHYSVPVPPVQTSATQETCRCGRQASHKVVEVEGRATLDYFPKASTYLCTSCYFLLLRPSDAGLYALNEPRWGVLNALGHGIRHIAGSATHTETKQELIVTSSRTGQMAATDASAFAHPLVVKVPRPGLCACGHPLERAVAEAAVDVNASRPTGTPPHRRRAASGELCIACLTLLLHPYIGRTSAEVPIGGRRHYKGDWYWVLGTAEDQRAAERGKDGLVIYASLDGRLYAQPRAMFIETVISTDGTRVPRFAPASGFRPAA